MAGRKTLDAWIREAMTDPDKDGKCSMMSLVHMVGMQQQEIHTTRFGTKSWEPKDLAEMFQNKAETYAQDMPGVQTFNVLAFYAERTMPEARYLFLVNQKNDFNGLSTEPPTEQGQRQQTMRQGEMLFQQVYRRQQAMDEYAIRVMDLQSKTIEKLTVQNADAFDIVKEMMMEKALSEHNRTMEHAKFVRDSAERKKWLSFAPALINTILGREVFPQSLADTSLIETFAENIKEEDFAKLATVVPPELMGPLAHRMTEYLAKKRREAEEHKRLGPHPDPEADAAGDAIGEPH